MTAKLRGTRPELVQKRLKMFMFGDAGSGKTTAAIQFPSPYLIDTEKGSVNEQYVRKLQESGGAYLHTTDLDEIIAEVRALLENEHQFRTLVIDPVTVPYNDAVDRSARELARKKPDSDGTEFGRHKIEPDRAMKRLLTLCTQLDMNVIMTSHGKAKWDRTGGDLKQVGSTFDAYGKMDYFFDLVWEVQARGKDERVGIVRKTRIEAFPIGEVFPFTYDNISALYGREVLERRAGIVEMATAEQVAKINHLVEVLKVEPEIVDKWFAKAGTDRFEEFPRDAATKVIEALSARLNPTPTPAAAA